MGKFLFLFLRDEISLLLPGADTNPKKQKFYPTYTGRQQMTVELLCIWLVRSRKEIATEIKS